MPLREQTNVIEEPQPDKDGARDSDPNRALKQVLGWASERDFRGFDPHDLLEAPIFRPFSSFLPTIMRLAILQAGRRSPLNLHALLGVQASENPKALALFLSGLISAREIASPDWQHLANQLGDRLLSSNYQHDGGWGYPFAWQSRTHYLKRGTPTVVVTAFVAGALLDLYAINNDARLLERASDAAEFVLEQLPRAESEQGLAFGYAPNDPQIVFNASLLGAELLARVGEITQNHEMLTLSKESARFAIHHQQEDGSWQYGLEPNQTWIDSFHTGFVLCSLKCIAKSSGESSIRDAAARGFAFFKNHFIREDGTPAYYHDRLYPVDSHSAAQTIITLARFGEQEMAQQVAIKTISVLQSPKGYFYYQKTKRLTNKIAYMRWSNAWMFRALAEVANSFHLL